MTKQRTFDLDDVQQSLFSPEDRDLLDAIADQATEADYEATAELLKAAKQ